MLFSWNTYGPPSSFILCHSCIDRHPPSDSNSRTWILWKCFFQLLIVVLDRYQNKFMTRCKTCYISKPHCCRSLSWSSLRLDSHIVKIEKISRFIFKTIILWHKRSALSPIYRNISTPMNFSISYSSLTDWRSCITWVSYIYVAHQINTRHSWRRTIRSQHFIVFIEFCILASAGKSFNLRNDIWVVVGPQIFDQ